MKKSGMGQIDSAMTVPATPDKGAFKGKHNEHPNLGPKGVDGGFPLKFTDESIPTPGIQTTDSPGLIVTPMKRG